MNTMNVDLKALIAKLNITCRNSLEAAAGLCMSRTNYNVEIEHLLIKLIETQDSDVQKIMRHFEVNEARLISDITRTLDRFKTGNTRTPALAPQLPALIQQAWLLASIEGGASKVRSGHLILALLGDRDLARLAFDISSEFNVVSIEALKKNFAEIIAGNIEDKESSATGNQAAGNTATSVTGGTTRALDQYTVDLTDKAKRGNIDPVLGRDSEIRQVIDILTRRRQNNPILTGEAGVGKTAVVEGFALRVSQGDVPEPLKTVAVRTLDLGLLQAGAGVKGEFENRLKSVIEEVKSSPQPIILFIDEAHTMIGAGGQAGQNDAANLLKPALARGELRTIAATTWAEYKKYFEKDAALARRFQVVKVEEPDEAKAIDMMRGIADKMEGHHNVRILDEAIVECVKLSNRYITGRQLPDKSVSVLDTACAKVAIGQGATPASVEDAVRRIQNLTSEIDSLEREQVTGAGHDDRLTELKAKRTATEEELAKLNEQWQKEKKLVDEIRTIRVKLEMGRLDSKLGGNGASAPNGNGESAKAVAHAAGASEGAPETAAAAVASAETVVSDEASSTAAALAPETKPADNEFLKAELK